MIKCQIQNLGQNLANQTVKNYFKMVIKLSEETVASLIERILIFSCKVWKCWNLTCTKQQMQTHCVKKIVIY